MIFQTRKKSSCGEIQGRLYNRRGTQGLWWGNHSYKGKKAKKRKPWRGDSFYFCACG